MKPAHLSAFVSTFLSRFQPLPPPSPPSLRSLLRQATTAHRILSSSPFLSSPVVSARRRLIARSALSLLTEDINSTVDALNRASPASPFQSPPPVSECLESLLALPSFFDHRITLTPSTLTLYTPSITIRGLNFGCVISTLDLSEFLPHKSIPECLYFSSIGSPPCAYSRGKQHSYFHPHISERGDACLGESHSIMKAALLRGDFISFFQLLENYLHTYNPFSPYISPYYWFSPVPSEDPDRSLHHPGSEQPTSPPTPILIPDDPSAFCALSCSLYSLHKFRLIVPPSSVNPSWPLASLPSISIPIPIIFHLLPPPIDALPLCRLVHKQGWSSINIITDAPSFLSPAIFEAMGHEPCILLESPPPISSFFYFDLPTPPPTPFFHSSYLARSFALNPLSLSCSNCGCDIGIDITTIYNDEYPSRLYVDTPSTVSLSNIHGRRFNPLIATRHACSSCLRRCFDCGIEGVLNSTIFNCNGFNYCSSCLPPENP